MNEKTKKAVKNKDTVADLQLIFHADKKHRISCQHSHKQEFFQERKGVRGWDNDRVARHYFVAG